MENLNHLSPDEQVAYRRLQRQIGLHANKEAWRLIEKAHCESLKQAYLADLGRDNECLIPESATVNVVQDSVVVEFSSKEET